MNKYQILMVDTDGVALGLSSASGKNNKKQVVNKVKQLEKKWQKELNFPEFELDIEEFDFVVEIGHKNYIYGELDSVETINTKGNNFKAKNKSKLGYKILKQVIFDSIKDIGYWELDDKQLIRSETKNNIIENTNSAVDNIDMKTVNVDDLIVYENVNPVSSYKRKDGLHALRTEAIERLIGYKITHSQKHAMIICEEPLPGITKISPKKIKATHYMWPIDYMKGRATTDLPYYKNNVRDYIFGAFGINKKQTKSKKKEIDKNQNTLADFL